MRSMYDKAISLENIRLSSVRAGQVWRRIQTGERFFVIAVGLNDTTFDPFVVYSGHDGLVWVRPLTAFLELQDGEWLFINDDDAAVMAHAAAFVAKKG